MTYTTIRLTLEDKEILDEIKIKLNAQSYREAILKLIQDPAQYLIKEKSNIERELTNIELQKKELEFRESILKDRLKQIEEQINKLPAKDEIIKTLEQKLKEKEEQIRRLTKEIEELKQIEKNKDRLITQTYKKKLIKFAEFLYAKFIVDYDLKENEIKENGLQYGAFKIIEEYGKEKIKEMSIIDILNKFL